MGHDGVDALGEFLALLRGGAHLLDGGGHLALKAGLALAGYLARRDRAPAERAHLKYDVAKAADAHG